MKKLLFLLLIPFLFSCKEPLPVYFTEIPGTVIDSLPKSVCGSFIGLEDIRKEMKNMQEKFPSNPGDVDFVEFDTTGSGAYDTTRSTVLNLNKLACGSWIAPIDSIEQQAKRKIAFGVIRVVRNGINFDFMDSLGVRSEITLVKTGPETKLSKWREDYFIAQKTKWGWELVMLDFHHKDLLSIRLSWFDKYNDKAKSEKDFMKSLSYLGTKFKTVKDKDGKILGVSATLKPDEVVELFKKADMTPMDICRY